MTNESECLGCRLANKVLPVNVVYENELVCCILDHDPFNEGHVLILPKAHVEEVDKLDGKLASAIVEAAKRISTAIKELYQPDGITLVQNGGIFNELTHFHMHVVPRYKHQAFADFYSETPLNNEFEKKNLQNTRDKLVNAIKILF